MNTKPKSKTKQKLNPTMIKDVYSENFIEEMRNLSLHLETYKYIGMV